MNDTAKTSPLITVEDVAKGKEYPSCGTAYFAAQRHADKIVEDLLGNELMQAVVKAAADKVSDAAFDAVSSAIWDGALERNMQTMAYQMVDSVVAAILSGNEMYARQYALDKYDQQGVRKAVAEMIGDEVAKMRIAELEAEVERLQKDNQWLREVRYD